MTARTDTVAAEPLFLVISRLMDAPPALVFRMWSSPEHLTRWWGPKNFSSTSRQLEFREGGRYHHLIHGPDGISDGMSGTFREIVRRSSSPSPGIMILLGFRSSRRHCAPKARARG
ncbi:SRPBCC domain-containing protein [Aminobacter sp. Piv2-1]|uniref:SRPBCC domain-containing protein n=1 Tax=Aminobacter sp. Piv2-1 TaxID=3031122 RepID=UPI0030B2E587